MKTAVYRDRKSEQKVPWSLSSAGINMLTFYIKLAFMCIFWGKFVVTFTIVSKVSLWIILHLLQEFWNPLKTSLSSMLRTYIASQFQIQDKKYLWFKSFYWRYYTNYSICQINKPLSYINLQIHPLCKFISLCYASNKKISILCFHVYFVTLIILQIIECLDRKQDIYFISIIL